MKSDPCPRVRPAIHGASLGPGPLLFVDLDSDGNYSCPLLPDDQEITVAAGDDYSSSTLDLQATASSTFPQAYNTSTRPILAQPRSDWGAWSKPVFLCWPDGTRKRRTRSHVLRKSLEGMHNLVSAVVDQYNEDHNLLGDLAYNLKDVLHHESFREKKSIWYRHLNFTANTKGLDGLDCCIGKLFFLELKSTKHDGINEEWVVSCFCMVEPSDNGSCGACLNCMKHPNKADVYHGGHVRPDVLFGLPAQWSDSDEDDSSKERRIRRMYEDYEPFVVPAHATLMETKDAGV
ncbi:hypothetical protein BRADI_2g00452v3 [Brachypodium distachyon]|uniref:DUF3615 domain-containing protein n=1 Tax=Brachypodium distachyon TaxID=15368 RepID=A0A0Q3JUY5_BRADI|nr:hypothetical protein BRADI_2g00452v3 [Brachypodium distachyon]